MKLYKQHGQALIMPFEEYGKRIAINMRYMAFLLSFLCLITPGTNWMIPFIIKRCKGVRYM